MTTLLRKIGCILFGHVWSSWEDEPSSCIQKRVCLRDGTVETQHRLCDWSEWHYISEKSCDQVRVCRRCGETQTRYARHDWEDWRYEAEDSCRRVRKCKRCNKESAESIYEIRHNWLGSQNICARCGEPKPEHTREEPSYGCYCEDATCHMGCTP